MGVEVVMLVTLDPINPRDIIEGSRRLARMSRDIMAKSILNLDIPDSIKKAMLSKESQEERMNLVMDCYNTGAAEMLKLLHGDSSPEPWEDEYSHEERLAELLKKYGLKED